MIHYHQTARLSATPLARHVGTPAQPAEVKGTAEQRRAALLEDARLIRERTKSLIQREAITEPITDDQILDLLRRQPDLTAAQIAKFFHRKQCSFSTRMSAMVNRGQLTITWVRSQTGNHNIRQFRAAKVQPDPAKKGTPKHKRATATRERTIFYILSNPGCTTHELAEHLSCTTKNAINRIADARKHRGYVITTKTAGGNKPARHWVRRATHD